MKAAPAALLFTVALAGAAAGFLAYRHHAAPAPGPSSLAPAAPWLTAPAATPALAIPMEVPDLQLGDLAGRPHSLRGEGRPQLFNFWATWCEPCRREIPLLNTLQDVYRVDGLQVVGIAVDFRDSVQTFLKTTKLHYTLLVGEEDGLEAAQKFGMELLLPFSVFADEHNRIVAVKVGELHRDEADVIMANMRQLKAGRETLAEAQGAIAATLKKLSLSRTKQSAPN